MREGRPRTKLGGNGLDVADPVDRGPPLPLERYAALEELRGATFRYCAEYYEWRFGERFTPGVQRWFDPTAETDRYETAMSYEKTARPLAAKLDRLLTEARAFVQDYESGAGGFTAERIARLVALEPALDDDMSPSPSLERVTRPTWLVSKAYKPEVIGQVRSSDLSVRDLAVLSLVAGFWPGQVRKGRVLDAIQGEETQIRTAREQAKRRLPAEGASPASRAEIGEALARTIQGKSRKAR